MTLYCQGCNAQLILITPRGGGNLAAYLESRFFDIDIGDWYVRFTEPDRFGKGKPSDYQLAACYCPKCYDEIMATAPW